MTKFRRDVAWSVGGLGVAGLGGILLNAAIGWTYGSAGLGLFNQVFAAYILFSQLGVLGVHHSTLKRIAEASEDVGEVRAILRASLAAVLPISALATSVFLLSAGPMSALLESPGVRAGILYATPGLFLFAINKVLLGALNGRRRMRAYASLQAGRILLMLGAFVVCWRLEVADFMLPILLTASEAGTLVGALFAARDLLGKAPWSRVRPLIRAHLDYGVRGFMSGVLVELNTRVDVLMLGYFAADAAVGVYSFAAVLAEGFFQLLVVLRNNYNPIVVQFLARGDLDGLQADMRKGRRRIYPAVAAIGLVATAAFAWGAPWVLPTELAAGWPIFAILALGIVAASGFVPFDQVLLVGGRPGWHTLLLLACVSFNACANALLIPRLGVHGAAIATGSTFVCAATLMVLLSRATLKIRW